MAPIPHKIKSKKNPAIRPGLKENNTWRYWFDTWSSQDRLCSLVLLTDCKSTRYHPSKPPEAASSAITALPFYLLPTRTYHQFQVHHLLCLHDRWGLSPIVYLFFYTDARISLKSGSKRKPEPCRTYQRPFKTIPSIGK